MIRFRNSLFDVQPTKIIFSLPLGHNIEFPKDILSTNKFVILRGIPRAESFKNSAPKWLIIDDQISSTDPNTAMLFTRISHHYSVTIFFISQNIFYANPSFRLISLNAHVLVYFKSPRSRDQALVIARQVCPTNIRFFLEALNDACQEAYSYFLIDCSQRCPDELRFRSKIFPTDKNNTVIYVRSKT